MQARSADQVAVRRSRSQEQCGPATGDGHVESPEPRSQGGGRADHDEEPVVAVDEAEDLVEWAGDRCLVEQVGVVDEDRQRRDPAPRLDQGRDVVGPHERHAVRGTARRPPWGPRHDRDGAPTIGDRRGEDAERVAAPRPVWTAHEEHPSVLCRKPRQPFVVTVGHPEHV